MTNLKEKRGRMMFWLSVKLWGGWGREMWFWEVSVFFSIFIFFILLSFIWGGEGHWRWDDAVVHFYFSLYFLLCLSTSPFILSISTITSHHVTSHHPPFIPSFPQYTSLRQPSQKYFKAIPPLFTSQSPFQTPKLTLPPPPQQPWNAEPAKSSQFANTARWTLWAWNYPVRRRREGRGKSRNCRFFESWEGRGERVEVGADVWWWMGGGGKGYVNKQVDIWVDE